MFAYRLYLCLNAIKANGRKKPQNVTNKILRMTTKKCKLTLLPAFSSFHEQLCLLSLERDQFCKSNLLLCQKVCVGECFVIFLVLKEKYFYLICGSHEKICNKISSRFDGLQHFLFSTKMVKIVPSSFKRAQGK